jgi:hypothetical protein
VNRWDTFSFRVNSEEKQAIEKLAARLQRSQSDAVRFVVVEAVKQFAEGDASRNLNQSISNSKPEELKNAAY